ncbi:MAG: LamG domain-containing protein [Lentisphaerae bacterium]|nr:LamG domain-containing protein [Lentisphaerota bacterium]
MKSPRWHILIAMAATLLAAHAVRAADDSLYREQALAYHPVAYFALDESAPDQPAANLATNPAAPPAARYLRLDPLALGQPGPRAADRNQTGWTGFSRLNSCLTLDGTAAAPVLEIPAAPALDIAAGNPDAFTITLWIKGEPNQQPGATILWRPALDTNAQMALTVGERGLLHFRSDRDDGLTRSLPPPGWDLTQAFLNNSWQHVALVLRTDGMHGGFNGLLELYVNGQRAWYGYTHNQGHTSVAPSPWPIVIGATPVGTNAADSATLPFRGQIDELAFYNKALYSTQIAALYDSARRAPEPSVIILGALP